MVARFHGNRQSVATLREKAGTDARGTNLAGLLQAAKMIGFDARGVRASTESLHRLGLPAIAHWSENDRKHFVVLYEFSNRSVTIGDPAEGLRKLTPARFRECWTGILVLLRPVPETGIAGPPAS